MERSNHNPHSFWLKEFKYTKDNEHVSKHSLPNTAFIVYSIKVERGVGGIKVSLPSTLPLNEDGTYSLYFGQHFSPQRNLTLFSKFYFDYDLSINKSGMYRSHDKLDEHRTQIFKTEGDSVREFAKRLEVNTSMSDVITTPLEGFYDLYFGYNRVRNYKPTFNTMDTYEAVSSDIVAQMGDDCFNWIKIVDGYYEELKPEDLESSTIVLDYKINIDFKKVTKWIEDNFSRTGEELFMLLGSDKLEFNLMFYPPSSMGLQFTDVPEILSPIGILKSKVVDKVIFEVKKSLVNNSQKVFEIIFINKENNAIIYQDSSLASPERFLIEDRKMKARLETLTPDNAVFEDLGHFDYPTNNFTVTYELATELIKFLADNLNYTIVVRTTDLTSERR